MKSSDTLAVLSILLLSTFACSSKSLSPGSDGGKSDKPASDAVTGDAPTADGADAASNEKPTGDAAGADATDAVGGDTAADGPPVSGWCTDDTLIPQDASVSCAATHPLQILVPPTGSQRIDGGACGGYTVWLDMTPAGTTLCLYDATNKLVGAARGLGATFSCSGAAATLPASCADPSTYVRDAGADVQPPQYDASGDAAPDPALEASLKSGLVALWPLDGDGKDRSGHGLDLTITGLSYETGRHGSGLKFTGDTTKTASRPMSDPSLHIQRGDFTVSLWVSLDPSQTVNQGIVSHGTQQGWSIGTPSPGLGWIAETEVGLVGGGHASVSGFGWRHLVVERSGDTLILFANGVTLNATGTNTPGGAVPSQVLRLGTWSGPSGLPLFGVVDDVAIWNRALTAAERSYLATHAVPPTP